MKDEQIRLQAMLEEARRATGEGLNIREVYERVKRVRLEMESTARQGLVVTPAKESKVSHYDDSTGR